MEPFGIMFHHFHDNQLHVKSQGSLNQEQFEKMLDSLSKEYALLSALDWYEKRKKGVLDGREICITFDDSLKCQYDIAYPVLKERKLGAFWFVYTSPITDGYERLEVYRSFRTENFPNMDAFYDAFFRFLDKRKDIYNIPVWDIIERFDPDSYLQKFSFYTKSDKVFRFLREEVLKETKYYSVMDAMLAEYGIDPRKCDLWMHAEDLVDLCKHDHVVGLHSHSHPTGLGRYAYEDQKREYQTCQNVLREIIPGNIFTASYPCNSYNQDTDAIMTELGIQLAFNAIMEKELNMQPDLHVPRLDHAYLMNKSE